VLDLFVLLALDAPPDTAQWQKAIAASHSPLRLQGAVRLSEHTGFLPAQLDGAKSGFYLSFPPLGELEGDYSAVKLKGLKGGKVFALSYALPGECASAFYAAEALVAGFNGVAFDPQADMFLSADDLKSAANLCAKEAKKHD
jgi:hypothetical protein